MRASRFLSLALLGIGLVASGCDTQSGDGITTYAVQLNALNNSGVSGTATITVDGEANVVSVALDASGLDATLHAQHIHAKPGQVSLCPPASADANSDGFVDVVEGVPSYGGILLPLDNDISTQDQNVAGFPTGATIDYNTSASLGDVRSALVRDDSDASDPIVTLGANGSLAFQDYAIVVHGTTDVLPGTVQTLPGLTNQQTLPVACGVIVAE